MKNTIVKKIVIFLIIFCCIALIGYVCLHQNNSQIGLGTFEDPYLILDCQKIEENFKKYYKNDLLESSDIPFNESTRVDWKSKNAKDTQNIVIDEIQYFGKERIADLMIIISRNQIDKNLSKFLDTYFSHDEKIVTTSQYSMEFDLTNKDFKSINKTLFVQRLTNEVLNNSKMMILSYRIKIEDEWFKGYTMIIENSIDYIDIPNNIYGEGEIYEKNINYFFNSYDDINFIYS